MVRAVALPSSKTAILLGPRFKSRLGHNIIIPFLGDFIAVDCDISLRKWLLEKWTMRWLTPIKGLTWREKEFEMNIYIM